MYRNGYTFSSNTFAVIEEMLGMENEFFMRKHSGGHDKVKLLPFISASKASCFPRSSTIWRHIVEIYSNSLP